MTTENQNNIEDVKKISFAKVKEEEFKLIRKLHTDKTPENLVGLAFSGGGIRSATFGLGVLEALKAKGLLRKIDYLSTVSGGGYIGAWLSANCKRTADRIEKQKSEENPKVELSWLHPDADWKESIMHLRRYSNYLSPNLNLLSADTWSIVTIWLRNTLLVQLMIFFTIASLLLVPRILFSIFTAYSKNAGWNYGTIILLIIGAFGIGINLWWLVTSTNNNEKNNHNLKSLISSQVGVQITSVLPLILVSLGYTGILCEQVELWKLNQNNVFSFGGIFNFLWADFSAICDHIKTASPFDSLGFLLEKNNIFITSLIIIYLSTIIHSFISVYQSNFWRKIFVPFLAPLPAIGVLVIVFSTLMLFFHDWSISNNEKAVWLALVWGSPAVLGAFSLAINLLIGMQGRDSSENVREWWSRFGAWLAIYAFACLVVAVAAIYGPIWSAWLYYDGPWKELGTGWIGTTLAGLFAGRSASTDGTDSKGMTTKIKEIGAKLTPYIFIAGLVIAISMILHLVIVVKLNDNNFEISQSTLLGDAQQSSKQIELQIDEKSSVNEIKEKLEATINKSKSEETAAPYKKHWELLKQANSNIDFTYEVLIFCLICLGILGWRVDINEFSLNGFYRSRLARCYLGATRNPEERNPQKFTGFDDDDDLKMAELLDAQNTPSGPLHIVNCALNLGGSSDLSLHTRHSANFTLTPITCGSHYEVKNQNGTICHSIDYVKTETYGGIAKQPTLGQAISVSGAAASPNMGYHTSAPVAFLMTLFNARLGWWFPNPSKSSCQQPSPSFSLWYLLKELFGFANEKSRYLAISDGGHFENLAAYELVKRRCRVIIISDGECDPKLQFEGLATLIRMCEVDNLVKKIEIDVRSIHPESESGWSRSRCAIGKIYYDKYDPEKDPDGWLIYLKASMNGHEDTAVMQYKAVHPDFPHETTDDQFYAEDQFESYRCLGKDITDQLFGKIILGDQPMHEIAEKLNTLLTPELPDYSVKST